MTNPPLASPSPQCQQEHSLLEEQQDSAALQPWRPGHTASAADVSRSCVLRTANSDFFAARTGVYAQVDWRLSGVAQRNM